MQRIGDPKIKAWQTIMKLDFKAAERIHKIREKNEHHLSASLSKLGGNRCLLSSVLASTATPDSGSDRQRKDMGEKRLVVSSSVKAERE